MHSILTRIHQCVKTGLRDFTLTRHLSLLPEAKQNVLLCNNAGNVHKCICTFLQEILPKPFDVHLLGSFPLVICTFYAEL